MNHLCCSRMSDDWELKVIVFDLDYTLWPFWVDTHVTPPFHKQNGNIYDSHNKKVKFYPEVPNVLKTLHKSGYLLGVASRTSEIDGAKELLKLLNWDKYFTYKEIYPGCKVTHFERIKQKSGINFKHMVFFDDEHRNIRDLTKHGVKSFLVDHGVTMKLVNDVINELNCNKS